MSEELIIKHCSPTLAGIKTANLFNCSYKSKAKLCEQIKRYNKMFHKKGLRVLPLKISENNALIYVYRPSKLKEDLNDSRAESILNNMGYMSDNPSRCLVNLIDRLSESSDFPHEIGLFLGYPPEDVSGFIENKASGFKLCGCWKVYGDVNKAKVMFSKYKKCTDEYLRRLNVGVNIERLAVAV